MRNGGEEEREGERQPRKRWMDDLEEQKDLVKEGRNKEGREGDGIKVREK